MVDILLPRRHPREHGNSSAVNNQVILILFSWQEEVKPQRNKSHRRSHSAGGDELNTNFVTGPDWLILLHLHGSRRPQTHQLHLLHTDADGRLI